MRLRRPPRRSRVDARCPLRRGLTAAGRDEERDGQGGGKATATPAPVATADPGRRRRRNATAPSVGPGDAASRRCVRARPVPTAASVEHEQRPSRSSYATRQEGERDPRRALSRRRQRSPSPSNPRSSVRPAMGLGAPAVAAVRLGARSTASDRILSSHELSAAPSPPSRRHDGMCSDLREAVDGSRPCAATCAARGVGDRHPPRTCRPRTRSTSRP